MILKALYEYNRRNSDVIPKGMGYKEIAFLILLDKKGNFLRFEDRRLDKKKSATFLVAKSILRSSAPVANLLWDNFGYVLGLGEKKEKQHATFRAKVDELLYANPDSEELNAIKTFYDNLDESMWEKIKSDPLWPEVEKNSAKNVSFLFPPDTEIVASKRHLLGLDNQNDSSEGPICLITGKHAEAVRLTSTTPILGGKSNGKLVAFQVSSGYDSYGKTQCANAPISEDAEFGFSTALNRLLSKESKNKFVIGDRTFVFWASSDSEASQAAEKALSGVFGGKLDDDDEEKDDPDAKVDRVKDAFNAIFSGKLSIGLEDRFYVLGLAPNVARIAVVYWLDAPLKEFASNLLRHFNDMEIVDRRLTKKPYAGFYQILSAVTLGGKVSDIVPSLPEAVLKSILHGVPYPVTLAQNCLQRIHAEIGDKDRNPITITRVGILKAYLLRQNINPNNKPTIMLDKENYNVGYLCGRLAATVEKIQDEGGCGSSIRYKYLISASTTPARVFPSMLSLSHSYHEAKLTKGRRIQFNNLKIEITDGLGGVFPPRLSIPEQGAFWIGYYQQNADFYKPKETNNE